MSVSPSRADLEREIAEIVARARPLAERLRRTAALPPARSHLTRENGPAPQEDAATERRLEAWCQAVAKGDPDVFARRLALDGLDLDAARLLLAEERRASEGEIAAGWVDVLRDVLWRPTPAAAGSGGTEPVDPRPLEERVPFEELLAPFVAAARRRLAASVGDVAHLLSEQAWASLDRTLLEALAAVAVPTFYLEYSLVRTRGQSTLDRLLALAAQDTSRDVYLEFIDDMLRGGLRGLFQEYPVLARLLATITWRRAEAFAEFLRRFAADREGVGRVIAGGEELGAVAALDASVSDPHRGQRSVIILTFASGEKVVYKPKDLGVEEHFNRLLEWLNVQGLPLQLKTLRVLNRQTYGWVEFAAHAPCPDREAAQRYYRRAGMLLCLVYVLEGTDCHYENIVAGGEHPILLDGETLLHHRMRADHADVAQATVEAADRLDHSVLRTGLLPFWVLAGDESAAFDVSGLGGAGGQKIGERFPRWRYVNTDQMAIAYEAGRLSDATNVPALNGTPLRLADYAPELAAGFMEMHRFLRAQRDALLAAGSPLHDLLRNRVRHVARPTSLYGRLLMRAVDPACLRDGRDWGIQLEPLARGFLVAQVAPRLWPIVAAEQRALAEDDIPFFTAQADRTELAAPGEASVADAFLEPSAELVRERLARLDESDLELQIGFIDAALYARFARETATASGPPAGPEAASVDAEGPRLSPDGLLAAARAISGEVKERAITAADGSAAWISPQLLPQADRFQWQPTGDSLYDGACGIGLFLAALAAITADSEDREWALRAVRPVREALRTRGDRVARVGIGGAAGLGGIVYALTRMSGLLDDLTLLDDAQAAARLITSERITGDSRLDVLSGSAGAILGLLTLHGVTRDPGTLEYAVTCGRHLLEMRTDAGRGPAWPTLDGKVLTGFSHGAAGIAYALLRLAGVTGETAFKDAARGAIQHENSLYSADERNWPDFREDEPGFPVQWCHGAAGIGLARLGGLAQLDSAEVRRDAVIAVEATLRAGLGQSDHLCCGAMGRVELLHTAGQSLGDVALGEHARDWASRLVRRAGTRPGYRLNTYLPPSVYDPGLFQGTAGIGYQLLRLARPDVLPSVLLWE